jgi:hypothetical protein
MAFGLFPVLLAAGLISVQARAAEPVQALAPAQPTWLDLAPSDVSSDARQIGQWIVHSSDHGGKPFVIVDKRDARVFVFDGQGKLMASSPALLGLAIGDDSAPGVGNKKLSDIRPAERTTPAGRFVANLDKTHQGHDMLWVDYDTAISMHPVVAGHPKERRAQRLASAKPAERRISYGCINVPAGFFEKVIGPAFTGTDGIVYVLPEIRRLEDIFASYRAVQETSPTRVEP